MDKGIAVGWGRIPGGGKTGRVDGKGTTRGGVTKGKVEGGRMCEAANALGGS